jgi:hypothetical protein
VTDDADDFTGGGGVSGETAAPCVDLGHAAFETHCHVCMCVKVVPPWLSVLMAAFYASPGFPIIFGVAVFAFQFMDLGIDDGAKQISSYLSKVSYWGEDPRCLAAKQGPNAACRIGPTVSHRLR